MITIIFVYVIACIIFILYVSAQGTPEEKIFLWTTRFWIIAIILLCIMGFVFSRYRINKLIPLITHIDKSKTKVVEVSGKTTDIYITVDGKEYHFEFDNEGDAE